MNSSSYNYYKYCMVPQCQSSSIKTPNKLFIYVPHKKQMRKTWLQLARRDDADVLSTASRMYFCEDHFDLPNDMCNYMEYNIMGTVAQVRMRPGCTPSKFECQEDNRKRPCSSAESAEIIKRQRMLTIEECLKESEKKLTQSLSPKDTSDTNSDFEQVEDNMLEIVCVYTADKCVQACIKHKFRSKAVQTQVKSVDRAVSPFKPLPKPSFKSSSKAKTVIKSRPSVSGSSNITNNIYIEEDHSFSTNNIFIKEEHSDSTNNISIEEEHSDSSSSSDSEISLYAPSAASASSPGHVSSDISELIEVDRKLEATGTLLKTIKKVEKKPYLYIGVPTSCCHLIDIISDKINIPKHHLMLCLHKIRLNSKFNQLADDYGMCLSYVSKIFFKNIPKIASVLRPYIVSLDSEMMTRNIPTQFKHKNNNVNCIIDCIEIEVQKPSKAVNQAMTWSEHKKANTIKYLISCTPNGLVNYISPGFGGRTTDTGLVKSCDFVKKLKSGTCVMADRGFKHVQEYLQKSGITLVRTSSVETREKMSKSEAKLSKQINNLRKHMEKAIRRLHEFCMLKPHSRIHFTFVKTLDDIMIIACALINLQDSIKQ